MNKMQALQAFWSGFGWVAIDEQSAFDTGAMEALGDPDHYITYEAAVGEIDSPITLTASLWHRSASWSLVEEMASTMFDAIGMGGVLLPYDGGCIWVTRGGTFSKRGPAVQDYDMRRILITINAEFLSA